MASGIFANNGLGNSLSTIKHNIYIWTNAVLVSIRRLEQILWNFYKHNRIVL